ncbi:MULTISPECIES: phospholipase [unclassified Pseudomonas]|uniref:phospholipase n=1 Tax=unclassified Pseudomonas TaxID=196821 RepID=UPI002160EBAB|nr:phospholipase [Pseudomonas sp. B21-015]UVM47774.1 phospholipase [Pseudomonas sp. B21-015]
MNNDKPDHFSPHNWMTVTPAIDNLSLLELTLPGTHNAGSDWKASYPLLSPPRHWLACQHDSFNAQLRHGSRALDVRLIWEPKAVGLGKFRVHHNGHRNSRTLGELITDIKAFLGQNPDEFIIVDFHELQGDSFDFAYFNATILQLLGDQIIPAQNRHLSLGQLKEISAKQRVLVAAPPDSALDRRVFLERIRHKWIGNTIVGSADLQQYIVEVLKYPPGTWAPWSLSATSYSVLGGPVDIHTELDKWFDPQNSDWAIKCNIINVDFIEESKIVSCCRTVNLKKASQKIN